MIFPKILIANRGEIACRIIRTCRQMGISTVAVYSEADRHSLHVSQADEAVPIGPAAATESYLAINRILDAARQTGAAAIHPGYGFLSENVLFAESCAEAGITFIGPRPNHLMDFGLKHRARELAAAAGVPLLPGSGLVSDVAAAENEAARIGYPVMLKSSAGGGGIGLQRCDSPEELRSKFDTVARLGIANFGNAALFVEKYIATARHIEVQIFGDGQGRVVALGERDCSVQRRNQKVIEETPAPDLGEETRQRLFDAAEVLGRSVSYASAGTVEFIYDDTSGDFFFLEVNTRLQVEHGITEVVTGIDLVEWMILEAAGELDLSLVGRPAPATRHAIELRVYAEDPGKNFQPSSGFLTSVIFPPDLRIDSWIETGTEVSPYYDPLLAKIIVSGSSRADAVKRAQDALASSELHGIETNLEYLASILASSAFREARVSTRFLDSHEFRARTIDVVAPGTQTSIQDLPGRLGFWAVGVPPSGPMDPLHFRRANKLVGNPAGCPALEITIAGPTLRFNSDAIVAICGAQLPASIDGEAIPHDQAFRISAGQMLRIGSVQGPGARAYLAISGGFDVPEYLGSRSTFALGGFGGHAGRASRTGDVLRFRDGPKVARMDPVEPAPVLSNSWTIKVVPGPHGAPDFFTPADIAMIFGTEWTVHYNSNRTGVRLVGPKPQWARQDGGEAGLHPSNVHDNAYAIGAIDFTGDMPILLGPDGPSLGGFVCPAVITPDDRWKMGQLKAGDRVRFVPVTPPPLPPPTNEVNIRQAGLDYLLIEFGENILDLELRLKVHALQTALEDRKLAGIIDLTPGIRSLQVHFDPGVLPQATLVEAIQCITESLESIDDFEIPSRIVYLPLSWDDPAVTETIERYMQSVRADAPWCPSNLEFIRRINGLDSIDDVRHAIFGASYLVLGLGDVYLGAPVATPIDPRHRLVTTKYNPARTWTPPNVVGIGGAYMCIYGMEGPGGYQLFGRTLQVWNSFRTTTNFEPGKPWLLRFFDQIRFFPVSADELTDARDQFLHGKYLVQTSPTVFRLRDYRDFLRKNAASIADFKQRQQAAFDAERERWAAMGYAPDPEDDTSANLVETALPAGGEFVDSPVAGNLWKVLVNEGDDVAADQPIAIIESMKMEIQVCATQAGTIHSLLAPAGRPVSPGQHLVIVVNNSSD